MSPGPGDGIAAIRWSNHSLSLLDQRRLPHEACYLDIPDAPSAAQAIADLVVRGAPAIGVTAAYAVVLSARLHQDQPEAIGSDLARLAQARPTAVNLGWSLARMGRLLEQGRHWSELEAEAVAIHQEDVAANRQMGRFGADLLSTGSSVLTHCNTGSLATGGFGTALGVIRTGWQSGRISQIYAGETRPWLQGARLTAWELQQDGIPVTLVLEGAVASLFHRCGVDWLIVGADRIAANGDVANKIGTYSAALHARHHGARVMVVAPRSTVDLATSSGQEIPIEERDQREVTQMAGTSVAAMDSKAWNPVFDITPARLIDAIVTEAGVARAPYRESLAELVG